MDEILNLIESVSDGFPSYFSKMANGGSPPKLDFTPCDVDMVVVDVTLAMATKDMLIKQGLIPADILK